MMRNFDESTQTKPQRVLESKIIPCSQFSSDQLLQLGEAILDGGNKLRGLYYCLSYHTKEQYFRFCLPCFYGQEPVDVFLLKMLLKRNNFRTQPETQTSY